ncbi:LPXTG cell wall anchor domain-containing protein [Bifidobacterium callimiconis]|nr:LPXTG cell wall anchor domain-containing protein [Bifidobacterium callimiconis]
MGKPVTGSNGKALTYGASHRYVLSARFTTNTPQGDAGQISATNKAQETNGGGSSDSDNSDSDGSSSDAVASDDGEADQSGASAQADAADSAADSLSGRDFAGQVTKTINGKTYILIGNEQQLRAIGTYKTSLLTQTKEYVKVIGKVWQVSQTYHASWGGGSWEDSSKPSVYYAGDADLASGKTLRNENVDKTKIGIGTRTYYFTLDENGNRHEVDDATYGANTGQTYTADANYIIFRNIDLSADAANGKTREATWNPLMFTGTMLGAVSRSGDTAGSLWSTIGTDGASVNDTADRPVISNVKVEQNDAKLNVKEQQGIGFFATITSKTSIVNNSLGSAGTVVVSNLKLSNVSVTSKATEAEMPTSLLGSLTSLIGGLVDDITKILGINLNLSDLLDLHKNNPSNLATGAFAGRIYGDVKISGNEVEDVTVFSASDMTGGFAGYVEGATKYDVASDLLGGLTKLLSNLLNVIPFLGLGDLIEWLLSGTLGLNQLVPVGYYTPTISDSHVTNFKANTTIGSASKDSAGGFVGMQSGAIIENSSVSSENTYTVTAQHYAGGFAGVSRNGDVGGLLNSLGVGMLSALRPQSLIENTAVTSKGGITVTAENYAGGFTGAMANSYAVNDSVSGTVSVIATKTHAGGFAGVASTGWGLEVGSSSASNTTLVKNLSSTLTGLLTKGTINSTEAGDLLTLAGVKPSAIFGAEVNGNITVKSKGDYAGGLIGQGSGVTIASSKADELKKFPYWKYANSRPTPTNERNTTITGLSPVTAGGSYAGGIAGGLYPASVAALLNNTLGVGDLDFTTFGIFDVTVTGANDELTVSAGDEGYYAGGAIGFATGGNVTNVTIRNLKSVSAKGEAGGFIGFSGPSQAAGTNSKLNVLGLLKVSGLLSVAQYSAVTVSQSNVEGIKNGFTVKATGADTDTNGHTYAAGGFYGQANSTKTRDSHVRNLKSVEADVNVSDGIAGGFVGISTTGGLIDALNSKDDKGTTLLESLKGSSLIDVNGLLGAVPYLIPDYKLVDVSYVNGGYVQADMAGGFAGDFQSGRVNQLSDTDKKDQSLVDLVSKAKANPVVVTNIDHVTGGSYAGGFGGKVVSGALASSGSGGVSILGKVGTLNLSNLLSVAQAYVPIVCYAGVKSDADTFKNAGGNINDKADYGLTVTATKTNEKDSNSGSAGGFAGYVSGAQISTSSVTQLRRTDVVAPKNLETTGSISDTYLNSKSSYAVDAARYAGGYIGKMDVGSAAAVGDSLNVLGGTDLEINVTDVLSVLNTVVSTVEYSDVTGGVGGYSVRASETLSDPAGKDGMAGGFVGDLEGGHIQNSNAHEFVYIIGQISAGGYVGTMQPGSAVDVLGKSNTIIGKIAELDGALSALQDFVPTIRNSSTDAAICGGAVRAQATSDTIRRGMAGGYVGHNRGGHIWGNNDSAWSSLSDTATTKRVASAARIRSVYGAELAGGYTGFMEAADTADGGSISVLGGLIKATNLVSALGFVYPTEEHSEVTGPLRGMSYDQWETWKNNIGKYGAYGAEFTNVVKAGADKVTDQDSLNVFLKKYIFGFNVVAGRDHHENGANLRDSGVAGGHVGLMCTGTITDGQSYDVKQVKAMRASGGYAGSMEAGTAAVLGDVELGNFLKLDLGSLITTPQVFVPVIKSSSTQGYRKGLRVEATGTNTVEDNVAQGVGNAGGYVGMAIGGQIWGDRDSDGNELKDGATAAGANVSNLRKVSGRNNVGGYVGLATSGSVADANTNDASSGLLQKVLKSLLDNKKPTGLVNLLQATVVTIRGAHVSADSKDWGFTVEGAYKDGDKTYYAINAGGFAGSLQAAILGDRNSAKGTGTAVDAAKDPAELVVNDLRGVEGGQYAGGFFGLADVFSVASVGGGTIKNQDSNLLLKLLGLGNVSVLDAFRTFVYDGHVNGVADGIQVLAHDSSTQGMLDSTRFTGAAGGFGGGLINGSVKKSSVANLNSVNGLNYVGGFIGHLGKSGTVDADDVKVTDSNLGLAGLTAGVLDIWGSHVEDSSVTGIADGFTVTATHNGEEYGRNEAVNDSVKRKGEEVAGGFAGYADLARISGSSVTNLKKTTSSEIAGGFVGQTTRAYLVDAGVNSKLVKLLLELIINPLLRILYFEGLEHTTDEWAKIKQTYFGDLIKFVDLDLFADGNVLYVNLFGLKVGVALDKHNTESQTDDTAYIYIGDSKISVGCTEKGVNSGEEENIKAQLIKGNRTKVTDSSVTGIADGYDVFGGGATQTTDGTKDLKTGYAGGFAGFNQEGVLQANTMTYADTIRGTSGLVDPFANTVLDSNWFFNDKNNILGPTSDGKYNTYRIYRKADAAAGSAVTSVKDDRKTFAAKASDTGDGTLNTGLDRWTVNYFDVVNAYDSDTANSGAAGDDKTKWIGIKDAVIATGDASYKDLDAYVSAAKAVLMLDTAVTDNNGGFTPEPGDGQDPCGKNGCQTVDLTLQKVWKTKKAKSITLQITAQYTGDDGKVVTPKTIQCFDGDCKASDQENPWTVTLDSSDGSFWSNTWKKTVTGLPVAFKDDSGNLHYYTYVVEETGVDLGDGKTITPTEAKYTVNVSHDVIDNVTTVTNSTTEPLPNTGGQGVMWIMLIGLMIIGLGVAWYMRNRRDGRGVALATTAAGAVAAGGAGFGSGNGLGRDLSRANAWLSTLIGGTSGAGRHRPQSPRTPRTRGRHSR